MIDNKMTGDALSDVWKMQRHFKIDKAGLTKQMLWARIQFIREELEETERAFMEGDGEGVLDGLIDIEVVTAGTTNLLTDDPKGAFVQVMDSVMAKEAGAETIKRPGMGIELLKPEGWKAPNLAPWAGGIVELLANNDWLPTDGEREAAKVLRQCAEIFSGKSKDYNGSMSTVKTADYWPCGIHTLVYIIDTLKRLRQTSTLETMEAGGEPNFDRLEDIMIDRIIYLALAVEWIRGRTPGQDNTKDIFNR